MKRLGITGHQRLSPTSALLVNAALSETLSDQGEVCGVSSLAEGADQIFAEALLALGGSLIAIIPSAPLMSAASQCRRRRRATYACGSAAAR